MNNATPALVAAALLSCVRAEAANLRAEGRRLCYTGFEFEAGRKHVRIIGIMTNGQRTARGFLCADGSYRRSASWKKPGSVVAPSLQGRDNQLAVIDSIMGTVMSA